MIVLLYLVWGIICGKIHMKGTHVLCSCYIYCVRFHEQTYGVSWWKNSPALYIWQLWLCSIFICGVVALGKSALIKWPVITCTNHPQSLGCNWDNNGQWHYLSAIIFSLCVIIHSTQHFACTTGRMSAEGSVVRAGSYLDPLGRLDSIWMFPQNILSPICWSK